VYQWFQQNIGLLTAMDHDRDNIVTAALNEDTRQVEDGCTQLQSDVIAAQGAPPIPDAMAQEHWSRGLADYETGANDCTNAAPRTDVNLITQAENELMAAASQFNQLDARIRALAS
jgi:hypothetical protein